VNLKREEITFFKFPIYIYICFLSGSESECLDISSGTECESQKGLTNSVHNGKLINTITSLAV